MSGENWSARNLDLSGNTAQKGGMQIPVGRRLLKCTQAELKSTKDNKSKQIALTFQDIETGGMTSDYIMVHTTKSEPGSQEAVRIGRDRLKSFLTWAGYSNPNLLSQVSDCKGLTVGGVIEAYDEEFIDKEGKNRKIKAHRLKRSGSPYFPPSELGAAAPKSNGAVTNTPTDPDDEIPF